MAEARKKGGKIDLALVRTYRARGAPYSEIGARMNRSPSAIWRALNQPNRSEDEVPAGKHRSTYLPDAHWELLRLWGLTMGESRAVVVAWLIEREAERRGTPVAADG